MARDKIDTNDRQLACARINSQEGQDYLKAMSCAANFAWVNRSSMTFLVRQAFAKMFKTTPDDLDMHLVYDVSHNIAKVSPHITLACNWGTKGSSGITNPLLRVTILFAWTLWLCVRQGFMRWTTMKNR